MRTRREPVPLAVVRELLDGARDALLALDTDGLIVHANAAAAVRLGRPRDYLVGKPFAVLVALGDRARWRTAIRDADSARQEVQLVLEDAAEATAVVHGLVADGMRYVT